MEYVDLLVKFWMFAAFTVISWAFVQACKQFYPPATKNNFWRFVRRTIPHHPIVCGLMFGLVPGVPMPEGWSGTFAAALSYGACGVAASYGKRAHEVWVEHKKTNTVEQPTD